MRHADPLSAENGPPKVLKICMLCMMGHYVCRAVLPCKWFFVTSTVIDAVPCIS